MCKPADADRDPSDVVPLTVTVKSPSVEPACTANDPLPGSATETGGLGILASPGSPVIEIATLDGAPAEPVARVALIV